MLPVMAITVRDAAVHRKNSSIQPCGRPDKAKLSWVKCVSPAVRFAAEPETPGPHRMRYRVGVSATRANLLLFLAESGQGNEIFTLSPGFSEQYKLDYGSAIVPLRRAVGAAPYLCESPLRNSRVSSSSVLSVASSRRVSAAFRVASS